MLTKLYKFKSFNQKKPRLTRNLALLLATLLTFTTVLLCRGIAVNAQASATQSPTFTPILSGRVSASSSVIPSRFSILAAEETSTPQALRSDIQLRNILNTFTSENSPSVRIVKDTRDNTLYYLKLNGEIYRVNLANSTSTLVYSSNDHNLGETQGIAIGIDGTIYLVGNQNVGDNQTKATIVKGAIAPNTQERVWSTLAETEAYPRSNTAFDHRFNGVVVSPDSDFIYVNSGSRTDHGEVQSAGGSFPDTREVGLTAAIFRLPTNGQNIFLSNDRDTLKANGYIFAEGTRNTFDFAFAPNGDLFGTENGPDRDMSDELNWLRQGLNYGFPWRIGGTDNPQQFPDYNPDNDLLLDPDFPAVQNGFFYNDPAFPPRPDSELTEPIVNFGPDADKFRDPEDGQVKDASDLGQTLSTFTTHRSPLGLVFDTAAAMSPEFQGDGFMLSFTAGDTTGDAQRTPLNDPSQDLLHLDLNKIDDSSYEVRATRIVGGFSNPIDAEIIGNKIYVIEYGGSQGIWEITMPSANNTDLAVVVYEDEEFAGRSQTFSPGTYRADRGDLDIVGNDTISSLRVPQGLSVTLSENETGGITSTFNPGDYVYVGDDLNDQTSLIEVVVRQ